MRFIQGLRVFFVGNGFFCDGGLVGGFFATVGVGGFLRQCRGGFLRQWKGFWLRQGGLFASVGVFCDGNRGLLHRHRSGASRRLIFVGDCDKQEAAIHCWAPLLGAIAGRHRWMPLLGAIAGVPLLGATTRAIAGVPWPGCHGWMLATNLGGVHVGCHCWLPLLTWVDTCKDTQCIWRGGAVPPPQKMTKKNTNAKTPSASFEEHYRKKQQMQKRPMHLGGRRLSLTHHEENKRE